MESKKKKNGSGQKVCALHRRAMSLDHILVDTTHTFSPPPMDHTLSAAIRPPFIGSLCRNVPNDESQDSQDSRYASALAVPHEFATQHDPCANRQHIPFIHILDDDSLLIIFFFCRLVLFAEDEVDYLFDFHREECVHGRWWYKLIHICSRWRYLVFASASYLRLCLVCTYGTPVADVLAHSPPLPLIIDYRTREFAAEDEEGIILALQHRDRVCRINLDIPMPNVQKVLLTMDDVFPTLEYLNIGPLIKDNMCSVLPKTFQAPHLRHLILFNFAIPIRSPSLTTAVGLVTLYLDWIHQSAYFPPNDLLQRLSLMPQLEVLGIGFHSPVPNREVEMQLLDTPTMTHITLPNLRWFYFRGISAYLEALLPRMTTPLLEKLEIIFFNQLTFSFTHFLQFISTRENLRFHSTDFWFTPRALGMEVYPDHGAKTYALRVDVLCAHLDWQVASAAQISDALRTAFSAVERITLRYRRRFARLEDRKNAADRTHWRELLRSFGNVKTLRVADDDLIMPVSNCLRPDDEESPMELLPELKELKYGNITSRSDTGLEFTSFIDAREKAGHPVTLTRLRKRLLGKA